MDRLTAKSSGFYGAKMKHLESALTALNLAIDKGAEFPDAVIRVSNATGIDVDVLTAEYDRYWLSWAEFGKPRKNPANPIKPARKTVAKKNPAAKRGAHGGAHYVVELSGTKTGTTSFSCHGTKAAAVAHAKRLFAAHKTGTVKVVWFDNPKWKDGKIIEG